MKLLRIQAQGLPLFKKELDLDFYATRRVNDEDKDRLYSLSHNIYLHPANAIIGINASGKTSLLKTIQLALGIINNEPINHIEEKSILGNTPHAVLKIYFIDSAKDVLCLETEIAASNSKNQGFIYTITNERLWKKSLSSVKTKKSVTDFTGIEPFAIRSQNEAFLSDDVSFIIAHNKDTHDHIDLCSLISFTNVNVLPVLEDISPEVIEFLDPTIESLYFEKESNKVSVHLKFKGEDEILLSQPNELERYLSSGTIKGIITFSMAKDTLKSGGYLLVDEIENHFNQEIVRTLIRFFMDASINKRGGVLIFTTHYPELLDEYERNDGIHIVRNQNGIEVENLSKILTRTDIKKSEAYQSGLLDGTAPAYNAYIKLKNSLKSFC